jgi:membrane-associated protein
VIGQELAGTMGALLQWVSDKLISLPGPAALAVVFLLPALEASVFLGFLFPGEIAVVIGGFLAFNHTVPLWAVLAAAILGAVIGDSVGYEVGKRWGDWLLVRLPERFVKPEHITQGKELINRLGGRAVFAGRFAAALRALVPGLCGVSRLPYRKFLMWNALGGTTWATGFVFLGYAAGTAWHKVEHYASIVSWVMLGAVVVGGASIVIVKKRKAARDAAEVEGVGDAVRAAADDDTAVATYHPLTGHLAEHLADQLVDHLTDHRTAKPQLVAEPDAGASTAS